MLYRGDQHNKQNQDTLQRIEAHLARIADALEALANTVEVVDRSIDDFVPDDEYYPDDYDDRDNVTVAGLSVWPGDDDA